MTRRLLLTVLFGFLVGAPSLHAKEHAPSPQQLMETAHRQADLAGMIPYVMAGKVVIDPGGGREKIGRLTIYRDHGRSRVELQFGAYDEIRMDIGDRTYIPRGKHALPAMSLGDLDGNWDPGLPTAKSSKPAYKFGKVKKATVDGHDAWCFDEKWKFGKKRLCFDANRSLLISEIFASKDHHEYLDYGADQQPAFPRLVKISKKGMLPLEVRDISVSRGPLDDKAFGIPPDSIELETCKDARPPQAVSTPEPSFADAKGRVHETVRLIAIITKDGSVEEVQVLNQENDAYTERAKHLVMRWKFKPATCSGRPINTKMDVDIDINVH